MTDLDHVDHHGAVVDRVDNPADSLPHPIQIGAGQLLEAGRARIVGQRSILDRIFLRSVLGIACRSLNTEALNRISYPAIVPQLFDHLGITDDRFAGPLLVGGDVLRILREGILDRLVDQGGNGFRGFDGFELQRLVQRGLEVDGRSFLGVFHGGTSWRDIITLERHGVKKRFFRLEGLRLQGCRGKKGDCAIVRFVSRRRMRAWSPAARNTESPADPIGRAFFVGDGG